MTPFGEKVAVVTGASSGIGKAIALKLAKEGADVCLVGRKKAALEDIIQLAEREGGKTQSFPADLAIEEEVIALSDRILQDKGQIDILVHSAGVISQGPTHSSSTKDLDWQYAINVRAPYLLTQQFLPALMKCRGEIVFINSSMGISARATVGQYAATKFALKAFADSLREEVNSHGVRVVSLYLGRTASPMQAAIHQYEGKDYAPENFIQPEDVADLLLSSLRLPRTAEVTDIQVRPFLKH